MKTVDAALACRLAAEHQTPLYVYDAAIVRARIAALRQFDVVRYAQKACSNVHLLRLMRQQGVLVDAVSAGELTRALRAGYTGKGEPAGVIYTADILDPTALEQVIEHDIPVNAGSEDMLAQLGARHPGHRVWLRINPGFGHGHSRKTNTGGEWSKHGIWHEHLPAALELLGEHQLELVGLHMHIGSGTDFDHLQKVCDAMVAQVQRAGVDLQAVSGGGGLPIDYRGTTQLDTSALYQLWDRARTRIQQTLGHAVRLEIEPGRYLVAEAGKLVATVRAVKDVGGHRFVLVDAGFDNLVRPSMYGSYHAMSVIDSASQQLRTGDSVPTVVGGPLCESGDVFTQEEGGVVVPRELPPARVGDLIVFHDTGAYGATMASNYNSRVLAPELLVDDGQVRQIRRRQHIEELLALEEL